jgi:hypothetical protein
MALISANIILNGNAIKHSRSINFYPVTEPGLIKRCCEIWIRYKSLHYRDRRMLPAHVAQQQNVMRRKQETTECSVALVQQLDAVSALIRELSQKLGRPSIAT